MNEVMSEISDGGFVYRGWYDRWDKWVHGKLGKHEDIFNGDFYINPDQLVETPLSRDRIDPEDRDYFESQFRRIKDPLSLSRVTGLYDRENYQKHYKWYQENYHFQKEFYEKWHSQSRWEEWSTPYTGYDDYSQSKARSQVDCNIFGNIRLPNREMSKGGDVIVISGDTNKEKYIVNFTEAGFNVDRLIEGNITRNSQTFSIDELKIIGNVYENPEELLKNIGKTNRGEKR